MQIFCGIKYEKQVSLEKFSIYVANCSVLLLLHPDINLDLPLWLKINKFLNALITNPELELNSAFGVFLDESFILRKKKIIRSFLDEIQADNFIFLLEGSNEDSYYANKHKTISFVGLELRFEEKEEGGEENIPTLKAIIES